MTATRHVHVHDLTYINNKQTNEIKLTIHTSKTNNQTKTLSKIQTKQTTLAFLKKNI